MKKIIVIILSAFLLISCSKKTTFVDVQGHRFALLGLKGKWVFVNYWATWCHACESEMPMLNEFARKYADEAIILGVNYDLQDPNEIRKAANSFNIKFPVLTKNPANILHIEDTGVVPTTYVFDPKGQFVKVLLGPQTEKSLLQVMRQGH